MQSYFALNVVSGPACRALDAASEYKINPSPYTRVLLESSQQFVYPRLSKFILKLRREGTLGRNRAIRLPTVSRRVMEFLLPPCLWLARLHESVADGSGQVELRDSHSDIIVDVVHQRLGSQPSHLGLTKAGQTAKSGQSIF
jgi:hypothetical protein